MIILKIFHSGVFGNTYGIGIMIWRETLSSFFVRNTTEKQIVHLFTLQPSKLKSVRVTGSVTGVGFVAW